MPLTDEENRKLQKLDDDLRAFAELRSLLFLHSKELPWKSSIPSSPAAVIEGEDHHAIATVHRATKVGRPPVPLILAAVNTAPRLLEALAEREKEVMGLKMERAALVAMRDDPSILPHIVQTLAAQIPAGMERMRKRIVELEEAAQWLPIEHAPWNRNILVAAVGGEVLQAHRSSGGRWVLPCGKERIPFEPTHFQRLPKPPAEEE